MLDKALIQVLNYGHITAVVVALYGNAEALSHCSCCHCQENQGYLQPCASQDEEFSFSLHVFSPLQSLVSEIAKLCLYWRLSAPTARFETLQDRPMRPELLWTHQPMTQGKGQNKVTHCQAAL